MNNQNKTRFEAGMPVIYINECNVIKAKVITTSKPDDVLGSYPIVIQWTYGDDNYVSETFNKDGFECITHDLPSLFTVPEYEALKALTDSFIDGTFGKCKEQPKFEPQYFKDNPIVSTKPFETYKGGEVEQPQPETSDLLDSDGKPVYFVEGMEVGCVYLGITGKVLEVDNSKSFGVIVTWTGGGSDKYTLDGCYKRDFYNPTLYPIDQYNQIQLPKLKPIQVAKQKEDIIELPSWFKGGVALEKMAINSYLCDKYGVNSNIAEAVRNVLVKAGAGGFSQCVVYGCKSVNDGIKIEFTFNSKFYAALIRYEIELNEDIPLTVMYNKNGKDITEIL